MKQHFLFTTRVEHHHSFKRKIFTKVLDETQQIQHKQ